MTDESDNDERLAELLAQMMDSAQRGDDIDLEGICSQNPELAKEIRQLWGMAMVADAAGSTHEKQQTDTPSRSPAAPFELPMRIGDYELEAELGRGGMGIVYRARQLSLNRTVAIKMILSGQMASESERERFQAEAEANAKLSHPGIVPVFEVGEWDGHPYFSMKYIEGETLSQRLKDGPLSSRQAASIAIDIANAVDYAHRCGVLHRDLKPSNIMLEEDGSAHVLDFGLAKQQADASLVSLTRSGAVLGTPAFMAPEQAAGERGQIGPASDVYSIGGIVYQMITGQPPFQAASPVDTVLMVLEQDPLPPRVVNSQIDRDLEFIVLRCLQKPPDLRYDSAADLAKDLECYERDEPVSAGSGRFMHVVARLFRETHHATILENWGLLWMWHSLVLFIACCLTNLLFLIGEERRIVYFALWTAGLGTWAAVFWALRRRMGPVLFVERQIAHVWAASMVGTALLFPIEYLLELPVLKLSPLLALFSGMVFMVKAGILSGGFYVQAVVLFASGILMAVVPRYSHFIFGFISAGCFFFPGLKYYRRSIFD